ncbi:MAG: ATP-grasp domain-containing protein [Methanosarcinaceae archaeon]
MLGVIECVVEACKRLQISCDFMDKNQNFVRVNLQKPYYFLNFSTPFGRHDIVRICRDKEFTYKVVKDIVRTPRTIGYLDPFCRKGYRKYAQTDSYETIEQRIIDNFELPVIVKRNQGTRGKNVFLCQDRTAIRNAILTIFNKNTKLYDYVAIAQDYIRVQYEYRVILFYDEILLVYRKDIMNARFTGNLSPLHWENSHAVLVAKEKKIAEIKKFVAPLYSALALQFSGLDLIQDEKGDLWLLEINSQPDFDIFMRDNGSERVVQIFEKMVLKLKNSE